LLHTAAGDAKRRERRGLDIPVPKLKA
jgi:hypothetical protein